MDWDDQIENCCCKSYIECSICGAEIVEGEKYYDFFGDAVCCECIEECRHTA